MEKETVVRLVKRDFEPDVKAEGEPR